MRPIFAPSSHFFDHSLLPLCPLFPPSSLPPSPISQHSTKMVRFGTLAAVFGLVSAVAAERPPGIDDDVWNMVQGMPLKEKVGQMVQITITEVLADRETYELDQDKIMEYATEYHIGSYLNTLATEGNNENSPPQNSPTAAQFRSFLPSFLLPSSPSPPSPPFLPFHHSPHPKI